MAGHVNGLLKNGVEPLLRAISLAGVALYVVGLLVFNIFLVKYGITDFAALKPQCLFTGAWTIFLLAMASTPTVLFDAVTLSGRRPVWVLRSLGLIIATASAYFVTVAVHVAFYFVLGWPLSAPAHFWTFDPAVPGWRLLLFEATVLGVIISITRTFAGSNMRKPWYVNTAITLLAPMLLGTSIIGRVICESVNPEVGGGRPLRATLYFSAEGLPLLKYMRTESEPYHDTEPENTLDAELLYASNDRYVFRLVYCHHLRGTAWSAGNIKTTFAPVAIDRKLIQAVFYTGEQLSVSGSACPDGVSQEMIKPAINSPRL